MRLVSTGSRRNADTGLDNDSHCPLLAQGIKSQHRFPRARTDKSVFAIRWVSLVFEDDVAGRIDGQRATSRDNRTQGHIHGVDDTGDPSQDGQTDVDQQVGATSALQEDTQRRQDDGEDDLADVTVGRLASGCDNHQG